MRIKCPMCKAKVDKKSQYCEYCGHEFFKGGNNLNQNNEMLFVDKNEPTNKTAFITCGEVFLINKLTCVLGIAVQQIKVGDYLIFNNQKFKVERIDKLYSKNIPSVEKGNCVLYFNIKNYELFKQDLLEACKRYETYHKPINFSKEPTSQYVFIDLA